MEQKFYSLVSFCNVNLSWQVNEKRDCKARTQGNGAAETAPNHSSRLVNPYLQVCSGARPRAQQ